MWDPPRPGLEPVSPALASGFLTTAPPGKSPESVSYEAVIGYKSDAKVRVRQTSYIYRIYKGDFKGAGSVFFCTPSARSWVLKRVYM